MTADVIAIDGPSASGKSTVARRVAQRLGRLYVDSGALYRGVTWKALRDGVACGRRGAVIELLDRTAVAFEVRDGAVRATFDGVDPGPALRAERVSANVSRVAAIPEVRTRVVGCLREMAGLGPLVMEGRDIGTAVFPDARRKFYLDASAAERARRRHAELQGAEETVSLDEVTRGIEDRDRIDRTRAADPLRVASHAVVIDSTGMDIDDVVQAIVDRVRG